MIEPTLHGRYGKDKSQEEGGLLGRKFLSRCPPIVTPETIVIAVCGPTDAGSNASPLNNGWFVSDFFLYHHLFRNTAKEQHWMMCAKPADLIQKYHQYAHGDPRSATNRRVVLDKSMLEDVEDVKVFNGKDLLERFLSCVQEAARKTKGTDRSILLLVMGHGEELTFKIAIGGTGGADVADQLKMSNLKAALRHGNPNPNVCMLTISCYGGGWVMNTSLNMTSLAGTNESLELLSWPASESCNRVCGSRFSTAVAQAMIKLEIQELDLEEKDRGLLTSPTYAALVETIHDTLVNEVDVREGNDITFSAQDDAWDMGLQPRTGIPLSTFQEKWNALKIVPQGTYWLGSSGPTSQLGSVRLTDLVTLSMPEAKFRLTKRAYEYMHSFPGDNSAAKNIYTHRLCNTLLTGGELDASDLEALAGHLQYRLMIMACATDYKYRLGLEADDCEKYDYMPHHIQIHKDPKRKKLYQANRIALRDFELFDVPANHEGHSYAKGISYLAAIMAEAEWELETVVKALTELAKLRGELTKLS